MKKLFLAYLLSQNLIAGTLSCPGDVINYQPGQVSYQHWQIWGIPIDKPNTFIFKGAMIKTNHKDKAICIYTLKNDPSLSKSTTLLFLSEMTLEPSGKAWEQGIEPIFQVCKSSHSADCTFFNAPTV